jgi:hypothetical protein
MRRSFCERVVTIDSLDLEPNVSMREWCHDGFVQG